MYVVKDSIHIQAPIDRCFVLSARVDLAGHLHAQRDIVDGANQRADRGGIFWTGVLFGLPAGHQTRVSVQERPTYLRETSEVWQLKQFEHDHHFAEIGGHTLAYDKVRFSLPFGWLGRQIARKLIVPSIARLLRKRLTLLKLLAESEEWGSSGPDDAL